MKKAGYFIVFIILSDFIMYFKKPLKGFQDCPDRSLLHLSDKFSL